MYWEQKYIKYKLKYLQLLESNNFHNINQQGAGTKKQNKPLHKWDYVMESWDNYQATLKKMDNDVDSDGKTNAEYIYDIFRGKKEKEYLMCVSKEFIILPAGEQEFSSLDKNHFNLMVYPFDKKLRSIRDLTGSHIPLLKRMIKKAYDVLDRYLDKKYNKNNITMEFHYTPSTYHLHMHVTMNRIIKPNKRHMLYDVNDIIANLESDSDYYKKDMKIRVFNESKWKRTINKYSIKPNEKFESAGEIEDFTDAWKNFKDLDCYKLCNK